MIIIGAGGFACEVFDLIKDQYKDIVFFDNINLSRKKLYGRTILHSFDEVSEYFKNNKKEFTIGIGNPKYRTLLRNKLTLLQGEIQSIISPDVYVGSKNTSIGIGATILPGVKISNNVEIGELVMIYYNSVITHDVKISNNVEISPNVTLLGNSKINENVQIGANATILPQIEIGKNSIVGAGAVVNKNVPEGVVVAGVPSKIIKHL